MSETPCQPSQPESGHQRTDPADIATDRGTLNPEQGTTESRRAEVSQFSHPARNAEAQDATSDAETAPNARQSADNRQPAVTTLPEVTPAENGVSSAKRATDALNKFAESWGPAIDRLEAKLDKEGPWGPFAGEETRKNLEANGKKLAENLEAVMRRCGQADDEASATGTEAQVCRDIARRQRRGLAKYGVTVIANNLSFAQWLQHFYEELLDGAVYAKRILTQMNHEPENQTENNGGAPSVLPDNANPPNRHRKPGAGRKAKPCPGCGATKSIGSTVKNGIPTRRCKQCGHVVQTYPHLANGKAAE